MNHEHEMTPTAGGGQTCSCGQSTRTPETKEGTMPETTEPAARRTKRRYAHELYPHPAEDEVRPLAVEVPYLYARAIGLQVWDTGWFNSVGTPEKAEIAGGRTELLVNSRQIAFLADALLQGMAGEEAWAWVVEHASDETGELAYDRAVHYGVPVDDIRPYPCGVTPENHRHLGEPEDRLGGGRLVTKHPGTEDDCLECTEPIDAAPAAGTSN